MEVRLSMSSVVRRLVGALDRIYQSNAKKKNIGRSCIDIPTLQTVITEVETIMNDRPLIYVSTSCSGPESLTLAHITSLSSLAQMLLIVYL